MASNERVAKFFVRTKTQINFVWQRRARFRKNSREKRKTKSCSLYQIICFPLLCNRCSLFRLHFALNGFDFFFFSFQFLFHFYCMSVYAHSNWAYELHGCVCESFEQIQEKWKMCWEQSNGFNYKIMTIKIDSNLLASFSKKCFFRIAQNCPIKNHLTWRARKNLIGILILLLSLSSQQLSFAEFYSFISLCSSEQTYFNISCFIPVVKHYYNNSHRHSLLFHSYFK